MTYILVVSFISNMLCLAIVVGMSFKLHRVEHETMVIHYMFYEFHKEWKEVTYG